jgi:hypothetical protein
MLSTRQVLDPVERTSEILFGLIMVLTFTGSISVAEAGSAELKTVLGGALGCNFAWGIVDAAMYLMASFMARARGLSTLKAVRHAADAKTAHALIRDALPPVVSSAISEDEIESLRGRLLQQEAPAAVHLVARDFAGASFVFLLVFLSTLPVALPFFVMREVGPALRVSNAVAVLLFFVTGWTLGTYAGRSGLRTGLETVTIAVVLVAITMALGG